jgi:peptidyl-prolyl cis-trans isomerase C
MRVFEPDYTCLVRDLPAPARIHTMVTQNTFSNRRVTTMARASARHILVESEAQCQSLKDEILAGADFADIAKQHSLCPSGTQGGELGEFGRGQMVPEFDEVVFTGALLTVHGPIKTQFGYHLLEITQRTD